MTYGEKIKNICDKKGIFVSTLEKDLGYSNNYIMRLKDKIPVNRLVEICDYLHISYEELAPELKKASPDEMSPLQREVYLTAKNCSTEELEKIIDYAKYILSKR